MTDGDARVERRSARTPATAVNPGVGVPGAQERRS